MRIKTQLIVSMVILGAIFLIISASVISTNQQIDKINRQEDLANNIVVGAYELSHLSNDYLLHQETRQLMQWRSRFSSFSDDIAQLKPDTGEQQTLVDNIRTDQQRLNDVFNEVASTIESQNDTRSKSADSEFIQVSWSRIGVQNQGIIFDASRLSHQFHTESDTLQQNNTLLTFALLGILLIVLLFYFVFISTRILRSLSNLQDGTKIIGSGNLDYTLDESSRDEIGDLSRAFNRMTVNLKTVTASKADLDKEIVERKRAEEQLTMSIERFKIVAHATNDIVWDWDLETNNLWWNDAICTVYGYQRDDIEKTIESWYTRVHPEDRERIVTGIHAVIDGGGQNWTDEYRFRKADSSYAYVFDRGYIIHDTSGKAVRMVGAILDITERKRAEEGLARLAAIVEYSDEAIIGKTLDGIITSWNAGAERMYGFSAQEIVGRNISLVVPPDHPDDTRVILERIRNGEPVIRYETLRRKKDGGLINVILTASPIKDAQNRLIGSSTIAHDITRRKWAEKEIRAKTRDLEAAYERITVSEEELRQNYEELSKSQQALHETQEELVRKEKLAVLGKLSAGVGHDLRNPLGAIKNAAYFLNLALENPDAEVKETIDIINNEVARCEDIISSLLDFARQKVPVQRTVSLNSVLKKALSRYPIPKNVTLVNNSAENIRDIQADPDKIMQVFGNLITNACQAIPDNGTLTISSKNIEPDTVAVTFTDTGTGITEENMKKIFEPLFTTKVKGIGLGLVVSKMIIELHGGRIDVQSVPGKGTAFTVILPVSGKGDA